MNPIQKILEIIYANNIYNILSRNNWEDETNSKSSSACVNWNAFRLQT